ncbi:extracellular solute-binding protein [Litorivicinus sp.]|nr:extracellular solute-binding protein [Litorivicinus sp.]
MSIKKIIRKWVTTAMAVGLVSVSNSILAEDWAKIEANAKKEGALLVYSTTSRTAKAAKVFSAKHGIAVEVIRLKEQDLIQRAYQEAASGVQKVDMIVAEDWVAARELLANTGYFVNYVPPTARELFPKRHQNPLVLGYINRVFGYNTDKHSSGTPFKSVWDLTTDEFKGRVMIRDVAITGEHQNALTEWVRRSDELADAYQRRFGKPLVMTEANAGLEFIKRFLQNDPIIMTSDTKISKAVGAAGQENPPYGMFYVYSKHRDKALKDLRITDNRQVDPTLGYYYPIVLQLAAKAPNPNAAKMFMEYLGTIEGFAPWADSPGVYTPNPNQVPFEGDKPFSWWEKKMWYYDLDFAAANRGIVLDTWLKYAQR